MKTHEREILIRFTEAALAAGKPWHKAVWHATYAYCQLELAEDYIDNCPRE